jgi:hypothetical protein
MIFQPLISYGAGPTLVNFSLPMKLWDYEEGAGMGGEDVSAAGIPTSYTVRWDQVMRWTLRFTEFEHDVVMDWLKWAMQNKNVPFTVYFDRTDISALSWLVYLDEPAVKDRIKMPRESDAPWVMTTQVALRTVSGARPTRPVRP